MEEKKIAKPKVQNIFIENRHKLSISGVLEVDSFNDEFIVLDTEFGVLIVRGSNLKINKLNLENAEMLVEGNIIGVEYSEDQILKKSSGFFSKLFS